MVCVQSAQHQTTSILFQLNKWKRCQRLINKNRTTTKATTANRSDHLVASKYATKPCGRVLSEDFASPDPTPGEREFPIAYALIVYKGADLLEKLLQAIYMSHNVYCIHVDRKVWKTFAPLVFNMTRCLSNVVMVRKPVNVIWGHVSVLEAQITCMRDLMRSHVRWKYLITLVGQDFPLYSNENIVEALKTLRGVNNIVSEPIHEEFINRTRFVHLFDRYPSGTEHFSHYHIQTPFRKSPPPHNITLYKGSNHIALTRAFVDYVLHHVVPRDFLDWLSDTYVPDEVFFASLQRYPGSPGAVTHKQHQWIMRALKWQYSGGCHGVWIRNLCWIDIQDLRWVLSKTHRAKLFVHKIPFGFEDDLVMCLSEALRRRKYGEYFYLYPQERQISAQWTTTTTNW